MVDLKFEVLLSRYKAGERHFPGSRVQLADAFECNLRGIDLQDSLFNEAYLPYSNLSQGNLQGVIITSGNLGDARFFGADLTNATLSGVELSRADFRHACLKGAKLRGSNLMGADFQGADLTDADLTGANLTGANLGRIALTRVCLKGCTLFRVVGLELEGAICDRTTILPDGHYY